MTDKKEIAELSIKVSVDTTELDKLEAQLNRIKGLLVNIGTKKVNNIGFDVMPFVFIEPAQYINSCFINNAALELVCNTHALKQELEEPELPKDTDENLGRGSLVETLQHLVDRAQKNTQQIEELTRVFNDTNAAIADKFQQLSIDTQRNSSGFA